MVNHFTVLEVRVVEVDQRVVLFEDVIQKIVLADLVVAAVALLEVLDLLLVLGLHLR